MTEDPRAGLDPTTVADLERRLADAAAEVARVQQQLAAAQRHPPGRRAGADADGPPPVVVVDGRTVSGGQPLDLSAYLDPRTADRVRSSLGQLGLDDRFGALFGQPARPPAPRAPVARLAEPPRPVPLSFRLATFDISWYELFLLVIGATAPVALWLFLPQSVPFGLLAAVLVIATLRIRKHVRRMRILRWGRVVTVTGARLVAEGSYYGGLTYNNMRKRQARGWDVTTSWYSGPAYTTRIDYTLDGVPGTLTLRGLPYTDGVVLADVRDPSRAMCVSDFPFSVHPEPDGRFSGRLPGRVWAGIAVTLVVEAALVVLTVAAFAVVVGLRP